MNALQKFFFTLGVLAAQVVSIVGGKAENFVDSFLEGIKSQEGKTATVKDCIVTGFDALENGAEVTGNENFIAIAKGLDETADDALEGRFFELVPDLGALWKLRKALKKS